MLRKEGLDLKNEIKWDLAPVEVDSIVITVPGVSISTAVIELAEEFGIDLVIFRYSKPIARLLPAKYGSTMKNWLMQLHAFNDESKKARLASLFVEGKIHNQRMVIYEYAQKAKASHKRNAVLDNIVETLSNFEMHVKSCNTVNEAMNIEAHAANSYWRGVSEILPDEIGFKQRLTKQRVSSNEDIDPFNIALNIGYSILKKEVWRAVFLAGLNPYLGFLHSARAGRMSLVFDLMEEFRAYCVDRPLIAFSRRKPEDIIKLRNDIKKNREIVWKVVLERLKGKDEMVSKIIYQSRLLAKHLNETDLYKPFKSRW
ncbi:MAG: CRISPR-associated endonuclease Cas1 [Candidatus Nitrosocaldaceae archaeon]|nr:MAG: CRISPR-associated endonuclease Cas1 [Candidatus Nitrosocaldaceae archaeon]